MPVLTEYEELRVERERIERATARKSARERSFVRWFVDPLALRAVPPAPEPDHFVWVDPSPLFPEVEPGK